MKFMFKKIIDGNERMFIRIVKPGVRVEFASGIKISAFGIRF